jgi:hypothetical protein
MDRNEDEGLRRELGLTRRELLRRGAIVGGTLLWATPVIQTIRPQGAFAASPVQTCCACYKRGHRQGRLRNGLSDPGRMLLVVQLARHADEAVQGRAERVRLQRPGLRSV